MKAHEVGESERAAAQQRKAVVKIEIARVQQDFGDGLSRHRAVQSLLRIGLSEQEAEDLLADGKA